MSTSNTNLAETVDQDYQKALKASIAFQEKQRKLIDALAGRLEELGSGDVLDTTGGGPRPSPSSSTAGVGPNSGPIPWNGTPNDIPTFSIGGKLHKAHILTDDIVKLFNTRLDMRLKICKYNQELERERNEGDKTLVEIQGFMDIEARGETVDSAELERLKSMHAYSLRRFQILADENNKFGFHELALDRKVSRVIRNVLTTSGQRTKEDPTPYLNHLADTIKDMYHRDDSDYDTIDIPDRNEADDLEGYSDTDDSGRKRIRRVNSHRSTTSGSGISNSGGIREASKSP